MGKSIENKLRKLWLKALRNYAKRNLEKGWAAEDKAIKLALKMREESDIVVCSLCQAKYDLFEEGGVAGFVGAIPANFCPSCHSGLAEFFGGSNDE